VRRLLARVRRLLARVRRLMARLLARMKLKKKCIFKTCRNA
jgi:hypothetical protein